MWSLSECSDTLLFQISNLLEYRTGTLSFETRRSELLVEFKDFVRWFDEKKSQERSQEKQGNLGKVKDFDKRH